MCLSVQHCCEKWPRETSEAMQCETDPFERAAAIPVIRFQLRQKPATTRWYAEGTARKFQLLEQVAKKANGGRRATKRSHKVVSPTHRHAQCVRQKGTCEQSRWKDVPYIYVPWVKQHWLSPYCSIFLGFFYVVYLFYDFKQFFLLCHCLLPLPCFSWLCTFGQVCFLLLRPLSLTRTRQIDVVHQRLCAPEPWCDAAPQMELPSSYNRLIEKENIDRYWPITCTQNC